MTSVGTHNLHDTTGEATGFAKVIFFTEAIAKQVLAELPDYYEVAVCRWQKDLIIAWNPAFFEPEKDKLGRVKARYHLNNVGRAEVTPHRGTYWMKGKFKTEGVWKKTVLICAHWINAAFPPFVRGEAHLRGTYWKRHQKYTHKLIRRFIEEGYEIIGGGDLNCPYGVDAFRTMPKINEVGHHFDRIFSTYELTNVKYMAKKGSDHPRLRATVA